MDSASNQIVSSRFSLAFKKKRLAPHSALFVALNFLYFTPLVALLLFEYSYGGTADLASLDLPTAKKIAWIYLLGVLAFLCGSRLFRVDSRLPEVKVRLFELNGTFRLACCVTVLIFVVSKVLLVPLGVYREYAFNTDSMTGGPWSFSMFCSESLLFLSIAVLFSRSKRNVKWFLILSLINCMNLLHGTRIFFIVGVFALGFYLYLRGALTIRRAVLASVFLLAMGFLVHVLRSHADADSGILSFAGIISPVMYETVFSQLSLIAVVRDSHLWHLFGSPFKLPLDVVYFSVPRFLVPDKDLLMSGADYADLSPLGAFSGYAAGLLYFGVLFPVFYFCLGAIANWMLSRARKSSFWTVMYVYFTCDCLLRVMRDGYMIPAKILIDAFVILGIVMLFAPSSAPQSHSPGLVPS